MTRKYDGQCPCNHQMSWHSDRHDSDSQNEEQEQNVAQNVAGDLRKPFQKKRNHHKNDTDGHCNVHEDIVNCKEIEQIQDLDKHRNTRGKYQAPNRIMVRVFLVFLVQPLLKRFGFGFGFHKNYSIVRISMNPVTSKISLMVSFTFLMIISPCLFITF